MKIYIEKYNPSWVLQFEEIKNRLLYILDFLKPVVEHIGSTSVPNLSAKPIIDVMVGLENEQLLDSTIEPMTKHGFLYYQSFNQFFPNRRLYVGLKENSSQQTFQSVYTENDIIPHEEINLLRQSHIHIWKFRSDDWTRHIAFREYLKSQPSICKEYESLKWELSEKNWNKGMEYSDAKNDFIKKVEAEANLWFQNQKQ